MDKITSMNNAGLRKVMQLKQKAKVRRKEQAFIIEGTRMFQETPKDKILKLYVSESYYEAHKNSLLRDRVYEVVEDKVFQNVSDTKTPQGVLAVVRQMQYRLADVLEQDAPHIMVLEDLQDPGNLGTIMRTGEGAGIGGLILSRDSADMYSPKVVRATMGSIYRIPFIYTDVLEDVLGQLKEKNIRIYAAALEGAAAYDIPDYKKGTAFLIGNEGNGLSSEMLKLADQNIKIPMKGQVESLNAAIAASLLMYEVYRQRR